MTVCYATLQQLDYESDLNSSRTLEAIVRRLPSGLQYKWAEVAAIHSRDDREPRFRDLVEFLEDRAEVASTRYAQLASSIAVERFESNNRPQRLATPKYANAVASSSKPPVTSPYSPRCSICGEEHYTDKCVVFSEMSVDDRYSIVGSKKLCRVCLRPNHLAKDCRSMIGCTAEGCGRRHHRLLHKDVGVTPLNTHNNHTVSSRQLPLSKPTKVALAVIPVLIRNGDRVIETCAFLDNGSDTSFILDSLAESLGLRGVSKQISLSTMNAQSSIQSKQVNFDIESCDCQNTIRVHQAWTVESLPELTQIVPTAKQMRSWTHLRDVPFSSTNDKRVSILLGCDVPEAHFIVDQRRGRPHQPFALRTLLGWTLLGPIGCDGRSRSTVNHSQVSDIERNLELFYQQDVIDSSRGREKEMSVEDKQALEVMQSTIMLKDGHYEIALPWRQPRLDVPNNRCLALRRLCMLKRRLQKNEVLRVKYAGVMDDYIHQGYAELAPSNSVTRLCYLPHHPVTHPHKPDKLRIVFDCSAKLNNCSLNDGLLSGPDFNNSLIGVLLRFRQDKVAVMADIQSMFHQVRVSSVDRDSLRFLWWPDGNLNVAPQEYRMCVHLFGATSSPSCAMFALQQTVNDNERLFDTDVVTKMRSSFYVDDCLFSVPGEPEAKRYAHQMKGLLKQGGFNLTKWVCNQPAVLDIIPESERAVSSIQIDHFCKDGQRTLGLIWDVVTDTHKFRVKPMLHAPTRRHILSYVSSFFDPMGYISPVILTAKQIFQRLCKRKFEWDQVIDGEELVLWNRWLKTLSALESLSIPRCLVEKNSCGAKYFDLHTFSDASGTGYGAAVYLVTTDANNDKCLRLLLSKGRVTPMSSCTIPRLELVAAVVSIKLTRQVTEELPLTFRTTTYWTDSLIVLHCIKNKSRRFCTYFANRLSLIHEYSNDEQWRYVDTKQNPADLISRGAFGHETQKLSRFVNGPIFLLCEPDCWPMNPTNTTVNVDVFCISMQNPDSVAVENNLLDDFSHINSWIKMKRTFAWLLRFKDLLKRNDVNRGGLTVAELERSELMIFRLVQLKAFPKEVQHFASDAKLSNSRGLRSSPLRQLNPVVFDDVLRVGGRLQYSELPFDTRHPIILPSDHTVTKLLIEHCHRSSGHMGLSHMLSTMRERYWILKATKTIKSVLHSCFKCRKWFGHPCQQAMAPLPSDRISSSDFPFGVTGVDYFGPMYTKNGRKIEKRYGCLFTCFTSRAVHIELSYTLETDSFLCAFSRFAGRRGCPRRLYSDNGSNFRGSESLIRDLLSHWDQEKIQNSLTARNCEWIFAPPKASHWGGVWERMIRSIKRILLVTLEEQPINDETLCTTLTEIERILNDRPLVKPSDDPADQYVLTPSKLLLLRGNPSQLPIDPVESNFTRRWRQAQHLAAVFWSKWIKCYLPTLQTVQKWNKRQPNLVPGDLVLLIEKQLPRGKWPLAIVEETKEDPDGLVREMVLRTSTGSVRRDLRSVCKLEGDLASSESNPSADI